MARFRFHVRKRASKAALDERWQGLLPEGEEAFVISDLVAGKWTPKLWNALAVEDRTALASLSVVRRVIDSVEEALVVKMPADVRASARALATGIHNQVRSLRKVHGGFFETKRTAAVLVEAVVFRDRLEPLLAAAKVEAKFGEDGYGSAAVKAKAKSIMSQWATMKVFVSLSLKPEDVAALKKKTPKIVASDVAARHFGISAEAVRLGYRRTVRAGAGGEKD